MPLGPRPEPPPVPKKEPRNWTSEFYDNKLATNPISTNASSPTSPYGSQTSFNRPNSISSISSLSSINSTSMTRLKGPRPLASPPKIPPKLPTHSLESPKLSMQAQQQIQPVYSPSDEIGSSFNYAGTSQPILTMPEPTNDNDFVFTPSSAKFPSQNRFQSPVTTDHVRTPYSRPAAALLVPPPVSDYSSTSRPTKSIFQWGIPAELLPPMPVPVDAMSGLKMDSGGQYTMNLDLPQLPPMEPMRPKFSVEQLTVTDFQKPPNIWSLSAMAQWIYELVMSLDAEMTVEDTQQALTRLFLYRINTLKWETANQIARDTIESLKNQGLIDSTSNQLVLRTAGPVVSGVITAFSGYDGCYSPGSTLIAPGTCCYSFSCLKEPLDHRAYVSRSIRSGTISTFHSLRAPKRVASSVYSGTTTMFDSIPDAHKNIELGTNLLSVPEEDIDSIGTLDPYAPVEMNWRKYWSLEEGDISGVDGTEIKLQFAIHELILSEFLYIRDLQIYLDVYGDVELLEGLSVMSNQNEFSSRVFDRIRAILVTNKKLLMLLLSRQSQQGPYVQNVAGIVTEWACEKATDEAYVNYANDYLWAENHLRRELAQNTRLQKWMEERAKDPRLTGRPHSFFFHRVLPRLARYHLLLGTISKYYAKLGKTEDVNATEKAIEQCKILTQHCDDRVDRQKRVLDVQNLKAHIVFKSSQVTADLKLGDRRRRLLRRGDMLRRGDLKMDWVETHTLLLDNFLVLSKTREGMNGTAFYVTKSPIPLDLLVLESMDEEGVVKVSSRIAFTRHGPVEEPDATLNGEKNPVMYPLRITHLGSGGQNYVLFVPTRPERDHWARSIIEAKQSRAQLAFTRSAEPFRLEKISDEFAYPDSETPQLPVPIPDTPLHRAIGEVSTEAPSKVVLKRKVNCLVSVGFLYLLGSDFGLWVGDNSSNFNETNETKQSSNQGYPIIWRRALSTPQRIVKLEVLDTMNVLFVLCSDRNLSWYPLDQVVSKGLGDTRKTVGIRLNKTKKVLDFSIAYHRGRVVVMYLQQGGQLKVIEPIRSHGAVSMRKLSAFGLVPAASCVDSFREVDRMLLNSDAVKVTTFMKSIIITTSKSFEWLTLDSKRSVRVPSGANSKEMQHWGRPVRLIKLDATRILMCYETCYVICDISGNVGIQPTTWFLEKCAACAYYAPYLILFAQGGEMLEIRYVDEFPGRLVQIITGKDIRLLSTGDETIYMQIAHPWLPGRQLILQLIGNGVIRDTESTWQSSST